MTSATVVKSKGESETRRGLRVAVDRLCEPELDLTIPVGSIVVDSNTVIGGSLVDLLARVTKRPRIDLLSRMIQEVDVRRYCVKVSARGAAARPCRSVIGLCCWQPPCFQLHLDQSKGCAILIIKFCPLFSQEGEEVARARASPTGDYKYKR